MELRLDLLYESQRGHDLFVVAILFLFCGTLKVVFCREVDLLLREDFGAEHPHAFNVLPRDAHVCRLAFAGFSSQIVEMQHLQKCRQAALLERTPDLAHTFVVQRDFVKVLLGEGGRHFQQLHH